MSGRYWAMDRDQRWERIEKAFHCITGKAPILSQPSTNDHPVLNALQCSYESKVSDEFFEPVLFNSDKGLDKNDIKTIRRLVRDVVSNIFRDLWIKRSVWKSPKS